MFLMKVIQKIRFALVIENEIFYINGSETLPPPLTREEEQHIMENIAKGDSKAREPLIVHNLRLVVYIAKKFETPNASAEDLISIGNSFPQQTAMQSIRHLLPDRYSKRLHRFPF